MPTAVVTGANSGIGNAFARKLIDEGWTVYAVDREIGQKIRDLNVSVFKLDVSSPESMNSFVQAFGNQQLDLLLNIAGLSSAENDILQGIKPPDEVDRLRKITMSTLNETFTTNAFGPLLLTQALLPNLTLSPSPRIGNMSSRVGSIADNSSGGSYAYRASKAALNSISKNLAIELREKGIVVVVMHPGLTRTAIDPNIHGMAGVVEPEVAAEKLYEVLMEKEIEDSGKFWHREGYELPW
ncbi:MAG: hypothetical protein M1813_003776 [Trichoglossum hirsutum]|nr:MAG: hypothetical protein M1813_003776 [Trichoglossum hirsutum]